MPFERARRSLRGPMVAVLVLGFAPPVEARLTQPELSAVTAAPAPGARAPLALRFEDAVSGRAATVAEALNARATLLLPVDYTCANVCDPMLAMTASALAATGLRAGADYRLVLVGLDPRDGPEAARAMLRGVPGLDQASGLSALVGDDASIAGLTGALGYGFRADPGTDSIAHPAAAMLLTGDGRVARVLSPLALNGRDLRLALVDASEGRTGTLGDRLTLLCYGYDAVRGVYTPLVQRILNAAAFLTVAAIALGIAVLRRRELRG